MLFINICKHLLESTLTRYHHHNPPVEACRDRYVHVPKFIPREDTVIAHEGLEHLKQVLAHGNIN